MEYKCYVIVFTLYLTYINAASLSKDDIIQKIVGKIVEKIPNEERPQFLRKELQRGYDLLKDTETGTDNVFQIEISDAEAMILYKYFEAYNLVTDDDVKKIAENVICWGSKCIDISDPGVHPL